MHGLKSCRSSIGAILTRTLAYAFRLAQSASSQYQYLYFQLPCAFPFLNVGACPPRS
jgi:hypothetical protein